MLTAKENQIQLVSLKPTTEDNQDDCLKNKESGEQKRSCRNTLNQIWQGQLNRLELANHKQYAKEHALEVSIGRKVFGQKRDDRSTGNKQVA